MRKIMFPIAAVALFGAASIAYATTATGTIKTVDPNSNSVTLDSGQTFNVPSSANVDLSKFQPGEKVSINYNESNGKMEVSQIQSENGMSTSQ